MSKTLENISEFFAKNNNAQLIAVAITASAVTLGTVLSVQQLRRNERIRTIKKEIRPPSIDGLESNANWRIDAFNKNENAVSNKVTKTTEIKISPDEKVIFAEQLSRNNAFFGEENLNKIKNSFVIVVGAGGVGSWAALMLLRSGVQRMRIIDFDQVTLSSLNRHAVAVRSDVGISKAEALKNHFLEIVPHAKIDVRIDLFNLSKAPEHLSGEPDYVLDCIDNIDTKLELIKYCYDNKIKIISAMGAGMKSDPSRIQIADIGNTFEDQLSRAVRRQLKKAGIEQGIEVVYSTEKPGKVQLVSLAESQEENPDEYSILPDFRVRIVPVLGTMPAIFGMTMATRILTELGNFHTEPLAIKGRNALYVRLHRDLIVRESKINGITKAIKLTVDDCGYVLEEIWRGKSAISGDVDKVTLIRWNLDKPLTLQNCVCMTKSEAEKHMNLVMPPEQHYPEDVIKLVNSRFLEEKVFSMSR
ncbi:hypothetical protein BB558_000372 [Smittium angustum]|uniref:THIF-type NAD/FAD binding fold domain-containing protein n=1 Tax=Smittium angustum TaxID=133377 RepID=A0A2U1JET0_SMIAN|nr:hypothetical protein BB558_000372 [Smittium angustum]